MRRGLLLTVLLTAMFQSDSPLSAAEIDRESIIPLTPALRDRCVDTLRRALNGMGDQPENFWPGIHAAEGLTLAGQGGEVIALLRLRLPLDMDAQHRCGLAREMVRAGYGDPLSILYETLADESSNGRIHAAESLYKINQPEDGRLLRAAAQQSENKKLQLMAAAAVVRTGDETALVPLRAALADPDREVRKIAAWALGLLGSEEDIAPLQKLLADETDPMARAYFVHSLACLGNAEGLAALGENLSSSDPMIRTYAADFASYSRAVEFRPRLIEMLGDDFVDARARAAQALIAFSLPRQRLGLPLSVANAGFSVDVFQADVGHPRYSEGSIIDLRNGSLLYATTEFAGGGADHSGATIVGRVSSDGGQTWGPQRTLQENIGQQNVMSVTLRRLAKPTTDSTALNAAPLGMFFLVKNSPTDLQVVLRISHDEAQTFGEPIVVSTTPGYHVLNNDRITVLSSGRLVCPVATTTDVSRNGHFVCQCFFSDDLGQTWRPSADQVDQPGRGAMEPEVIELRDKRLMMIIRTQLGYIATSISEDGGDHWAAPGRLTVQAPEAPATIRRLPETGDLLLIWNNTYQSGVGHGGARTPLTAAISADEGATWKHLRNLETNPEQGFAYTSILFHQDRALLSYYVASGGTISSRFRSLPQRWFYAK